MKSQERGDPLGVSYRTMKMDEFGDAIFYRTSCDCGDPDHDLTMEMSLNKDIRLISLHIFGNMEISSYWGFPPWWKNIWKRIRSALKILFLGYEEANLEFILQQENHIQGLINALEEGKIKLIGDKETENVGG